MYRIKIDCIDCVEGVWKVVRADEFEAKSYQDILSIMKSYKKENSKIYKKIKGKVYIDGKYLGAIGDD